MLNFSLVRPWASFEVPLCSPGPLETGTALQIAHFLLQAHHLAKQPRPAIPLRAHHKIRCHMTTFHEWNRYKMANNKHNSTKKGPKWTTRGKNPIPSPKCRPALLCMLNHCAKIPFREAGRLFGQNRMSFVLRGYTHGQTTTLAEISARKTQNTEQTHHNLWQCVAEQIPRWQTELQTEINPSPRYPHRCVPPHLRLQRR